MVHAGQALMAWASATPRSSRAATPSLITKQAAGKAKIDPLMRPLQRLRADEPMNPEAGPQGRLRGS
jgi:phage terminase large subunit-like protein